jgi:hypothetical protein
MKKEKHCKKHRTYGDCKYCEMEKEKIKKEEKQRILNELKE